MANENIRFPAKNMAVDFSDNQELFFNITSESNSIKSSLLIKNINGDIIYTYPASIPLTSPVLSLVYTGFYFWTLQNLVVGSLVNGSVIRKWEIDEQNNILMQLKSKSFYNSTNTYNNFSTLVCEHYNMKLIEDFTSGQSYIKVRFPEDYLPTQKIQSGSKIKIGPNNLGQYYDGLVNYTQYYNHPSQGYCTIHFQTITPFSFQEGNNAFLEYALWVTNNKSIYDNKGSLTKIHPESFDDTEELTSGIFKNVECSCFFTVDNIPRINSYNRTNCLFLKINHCVFVWNLDDLAYIETSFMIDGNHFDYNKQIPSYGLSLRHNPDSLDDHPQFYILQQHYRASEVSYYEFQYGYNLIIKKLDPYPCFINLSMQPMILTSSGLSNLKCQLLDQYNFPIQAGHYTHWATDGFGDLLGWPGYPDVANIPTDSNGIARNRYQALAMVSNSFYYNITVSTLVT